MKTHSLLYGSVSKEYLMIAPDHSISNSILVASFYRALSLDHHAYADALTGEEYLSFLRSPFAEATERMDKVDAIHYAYRPIYEQLTSRMKVSDGKSEQERENAKIVQQPKQNKVNLEQSMRQIQEVCPKDAS